MSSEFFDETKREPSGFVPLNPGLVMVNPSTGETIRTPEEQRSDFQHREEEYETSKGRTDLPSTEDIIRERYQDGTDIADGMTVRFTDES